MGDPGSGRRPYKRVLLKLSGESFCSRGSFGVEGGALRTIASEVASALDAGAQVAVVVGGGNIIRGARLAEEGLIDQATADAMGMLGTIINALALTHALSGMGREARCMSAVAARGIAEGFDRLEAGRHLDAGRVVVLGGGVGSPFFTTDSGAALRAIELGCDAVFKATKVDGVYSADPKKDPGAKRYERLTLTEAIDKRLGVMDLGAMAMCRDHGMPVLVFNFDTPGNIRRAIEGHAIGTLASP